MKIIAVLFAAVVLLAGCSGSSDDEPAPEKTSAKVDARPQAEVQAESQAKQQQEALKDLEKQVREEAAQTIKGVVIDIGLYSDREPTPQGERVEAKVGEKITLRVTSAVEDELHVHSDPEHTFDVKPGKDQLFTFTVDTPGQVAVEAHHAGVTLVQLVVRP